MASDWQGVAEQTPLRPAVPPPFESGVRGAEEALGCRLSASLRDLYAQTNGLLDEWGYAYVFSLGELVQRNRQFRTQNGDIYMSFPGLVIFGQIMRAMSKMRFDV